MKKIPLILACCLITACGVSCNNKNNSNTGNEISYGQIQKNGSGEDALKEFFTANYTRDSGEVAFSYMYIQPIIDDMIAKNEYRELIQNYNSGKNEYLDIIKTAPSLKSINVTTPLNEEQLGWAEQYFIDYAATREIVLENITVTEGYDFQCTVIDQNGNENSDTECLVKVDGDGWKYIGSLRSLESRYGSGAEATSGAAE